jgi:hypothetical protein
VGAPGEGDAPSLGAGGEPKGDAFAVVPAEARREPAPEAKPTYLDVSAGDTQSAVIELAAHTPKPNGAAAVAREAEGLVTVRPKPEKRKNAKERAKEKHAKNTARGGTTPDTTAKAKSKAVKAERKEKAKKAKMA